MPYESFLLPGGVMVAQATLNRFVEVRILAGQPLLSLRFREEAYQ